MSPRAQLTQEGAILGTPMYMPPEGILGGAQLGTAGDVFAFGVIAFELLTGEYPFADVPIRVAIGDAEFSPRAAALDALRSRAPDLYATLLACLARRPEARPTIAQVEHALASPPRGFAP